ncbi:MAG: AI-2E family transporter [Planctomycetes bacterium]|nr:AI-2E family transporter [Planctomycetota bacterium]
MTSNPLPAPWNKFVPFLQRLVIWGLFFGALWALRPFFFLVFLTFVFGYVLNHGVEALAPRIKHRQVRVVLLFVLLLGTLVGVGFTLAPSLTAQAKTLPADLQKALTAADSELAKWREKSEVLREVMPSDFSVKQIAGEFFTSKPSDDGSGNLAHAVFGIAQSTLAIGTSFLLSLLFSFLIVLDLPRLTAGARSLRDSRLRYVYDEVADSIVVFGRILGRALEAQLMIAILNTALTAIGLALMELPYIAFLSTVVFICSFIPVAGVFMSSVPICLTAVKVSGIGLMLIAIAFITVIHMIEAYILNPLIYGAHLRMNPVLVLAILVISHHLFGIWGLVLGVPVMNYVAHYVISSVGRPREP